MGSRATLRSSESFDRIASATAAKAHNEQSGSSPKPIKRVSPLTLSKFSIAAGQVPCSRRTRSAKPGLGPRGADGVAGAVRSSIDPFGRYLVMSAKNQSVPIDQLRAVVVREAFHRFHQCEPKGLLYGLDELFQSDAPFAG